MKMKGLVISILYKITFWLYNIYKMRWMHLIYKIVFDYILYKMTFDSNLYIKLHLTVYSMQHFVYCILYAK